MGQRVFLYDGSPTGRVARAAILREAGYEVSAAGSLADANLLLCGAGHFDVIVLSYSEGATGVLSAYRGLQRPMPIVLVASKLDLLSAEAEHFPAAAVVKKCANEVRNLLRAVDQATRARPDRRRPSSARYAMAARARA